MTTIIVIADLHICPIAILESAAEEMMTELESRTSQYELAIALGLEDVLDPNFHVYAETMGELILETIDTIAEARAEEKINDLLDGLEDFLVSIFGEAEEEEPEVVGECCGQYKSPMGMMELAFLSAMDGNKGPAFDILMEAQGETEAERLDRNLVQIQEELGDNNPARIELIDNPTFSDEYLEALHIAVEELYPFSEVVVVQPQADLEEAEVVLDDELELDDGDDIAVVAVEYLRVIEARLVVEQELGHLEIEAHTERDLEFADVFSDLVINEYPHITVSILDLTEV